MFFNTIFIIKICYRHYAIDWKNIEGQRLGWFALFFDKKYSSISSQVELLKRRKVGEIFQEDLAEIFQMIAYTSRVSPYLILEDGQSLSLRYACLYPCPPPISSYSNFRINILNIVFINILNIYLILYKLIVYEHNYCA